ncbi:unnamed protein product, partial [Symbiodinium sp. CCMP2592]
EMMPMPTPSFAPVPSPSGDQDLQDEYEDFSDKVETLLSPLKALYGRVAAYEFLSRAFAVIDRYKTRQVPLPKCCAYSLLSFAMALSGIADEDTKRAEWFALVTTTSQNAVAVVNA